MAVTNSTDKSKRFSVLALPYEMRDLSIAKELMIDYETGHIYVRDKDGINILCITKDLEQMIKNITNAGGDNIKVLDPTANKEDILNKVLANIFQYVNAAIEGLSIKHPARVLSEVDLPLRGIPHNVDNVTDLKEGDTILLIGQSDKRENGKWVISNDEWVRHKDLDTNTELNKSPFLFISEGDKYKETGWVLASDNVTIGVSDLEWTIFTRADEVTACYGLQRVGNEFSLRKITTGGTATKITWDEYGKVVRGETPSTLSEMGIVDGVPLDHVGSGGDQHAIVTEDESGFASPADKKVITEVFPAIENLEEETQVKLDEKSEIEFLDEFTPITLDLKDKMPLADNLKTDSAELGLSARQGKVLKDLLDYLFVNTNEDGNPYMKLWMGTLNQYYSLQEKDTATTLYMAMDTVEEYTKVTLDSSIEDLISLIQIIQSNKVSRSGDQVNGPLIVGSAIKDQIFKVYGDFYLNGIKITELFAAIDHEHPDMITERILNAALAKKADKNHEHEMEDIKGLIDALKNKASKDHTHNDKYYTIEDADLLFKTKAPINHTHKAKDIIDLNTIVKDSQLLALKNMTQDPLHRTVTDADIVRWNSMCNSNFQLPSGPMDGSIREHNSSDTAHLDIREYIKDINRELGDEQLSTHGTIKGTINDIIEALPSEETTVKLKSAFSTTTLTEDSNKINIGYPSFDENIHTLLVMKNSVYMYKDVDFIINSDNTITTNEVIPKGTIISFIILWTEGNAVVGGGGSIGGTGTIDSIRGLREILDNKSDIDHTHLLKDMESDPDHRTVTDEQIKKWDSGTGTGGASSIDIERHNESPLAHDDIRNEIKELKESTLQVESTMEVIDFTAISDNQTEFTINKNDLLTRKYVHFAVINGITTNDYTLRDRKIILNEGIKKNCTGHLYLIYTAGNAVTDGGSIKNLTIESFSSELRQLIESKTTPDNIYTSDEIDTMVSELVSRYELQNIVNKADITEVFTRDEVNQLIQNVLDNLYTKSTIDSELDKKADKTTTYTKDEVDTKIRLSAGEAATNSYTKKEVDSKLSEKANTTEVYSKTEIDTMLASIKRIEPISQASYDSLSSDKKNDPNIIYAIY